MTLGDYAAAQLIDDTEPPSIVISSPVAATYAHAGQLEIDFSVSDALSGVWSTTAELDGVAVTDGQRVELLALSLGQHTLIVRAEDTAGNVAAEQVTFTVEATAYSLHDAIEQLVEAGEIAAQIERSLLAKVDAAAAAIAGGDLTAAAGILQALIAQVNALEGKKISPDAAAILRQDVAAILDGLG